MITLTFQFNDIASAAALLANLNGQQLGAIVPAVVKAVAATAAEAPGKPSAATTARSPRTAAADPSPTAPSDDAPAQAPTATSPAAPAPSVAPSVTYPDLQKAVLTLHKIDATAAVPIAKSLGADTFKLLKPEQWADALAAVNAKIAELQAA